MNRLNQDPPETSAFTFATSDGTSYRTGIRSDSSPQEIDMLGNGPPPDGYATCVAAGCFHTGLYRAQISAFSPDGSTAEIEAQLGLLQVN
jgi:hypothetical protein